MAQHFPNRVETLRDMERDFPELQEDAPMLLTRAICSHYRARMFGPAANLSDRLLEWHGVDLPSWQYGAAAKCVLQIEPEERIAEHRDIVAFCLNPSDHLPLESEPTEPQLARRLSMARFNLGDEYEEANRLEEAIEAFELSLEGQTDPEMRVARLARLAGLYLATGQRERAAERFAASHETHPIHHAKRVRQLLTYYPELESLSPSH